MAAKTLRAQSSAAPLKHRQFLPRLRFWTRPPRSIERGPVEAILRAVLLMAYQTLRAQSSAAPLKRVPITPGARRF